MLECLTGLIDVRGCKRTNGSTPVVYISDLPGISVKSLDMVADSDKENYKGVLTAIYNRAVLRIINDFHSQSGINSRVKVFNNSYCNGKYITPFEEIPPSSVSVDQGILFTFPLSKYLSLRLQSIRFFSSSISNVTFFVKEALSGAILKEVTVQVNQGDNFIPLDVLVFPAPYRQQLFVGYDGSSTGYYKTINTECYDDCNCTCEIVSCSGCTSVRGMQTNTLTDETYGLSVTYNLECSAERLICENKSSFTTALLYASGIEYIHEVYGSDRINYFTSTNAEEREKLLEDFNKRYWSGLKTAIKNISFCDDCCFECIEKVTYQYVSP